MRCRGPERRVFRKELEEQLMTGENAEGAGQPPSNESVTHNVG